MGQSNIDVKKAATNSRVWNWCQWILFRGTNGHWDDVGLWTCFSTYTAIQKVWALVKTTPSFFNSFYFQLKSSELLKKKFENRGRGGGGGIGKPDKICPRNLYFWSHNITTAKKKLLSLAIINLLFVDYFKGKEDFHSKYSGTCGNNHISPLYLRAMVFLIA